jgi:hypothetical protein
MVIQFYNPSTREAEAGGSRVGYQPGLHSKTYLKERERERERERETWTSNS